MLLAHALGALDTAAARELEDHLRSCAECRAELEDWRDASAALAYVATPVEPSIALRARILDSVRAQSSGGDDGGTETQGGAAEPAGPQSNVVPFAPAPRTWSSAQQFGALAAALLIALLLVTLLVLWNKNRRLETQLAARVERENQLQAENQRLSRLNEEKESEIARLSNRNENSLGEIARPPDRGNDNSQQLPTPTPPVVRPGPTEEAVVTPTPGAASAVALLAGTGVAPQARGRLVYDRQSGRATLYASNLPPLPSGKAYQLWFIVGGRPISGGVFKTDATGRAVLQRQMPTEARNASEFAVTLEPQGGVSAPTGEKYLIGRAS